jgi:hypothetical protein
MPLVIGLVKDELQKLPKRSFPGSVKYQKTIGLSSDNPIGRLKIFLAIKPFGAFHPNISADQVAFCNEVKLVVSKRRVKIITPDSKLDLFSNLLKKNTITKGQNDVATIQINFSL